MVMKLVDEFNCHYKKAPTAESRSALYSTKAQLPNEQSDHANEIGAPDSCLKCALKMTNVNDYHCQLMMAIVYLE